MTSRSLRSSRTERLIIALFWRAQTSLLFHRRGHRIRAFLSIHVNTQNIERSNSVCQRFGTIERARITKQQPGHCPPSTTFYPSKKTKPNPGATDSFQQKPWHFFSNTIVNLTLEVIYIQPIYITCTTHLAPINQIGRASCRERV